MRKKWEYLYATTDLGYFIKEKELVGEMVSKRLNELGKQGWELVGFTVDERGFVWVLKREISRGRSQSAWNKGQQF